MRSAFDKKFSKAQLTRLFEYQHVLPEYGDIDEYLEQYDGPCRGGIEATFNDDIITIPDPSTLDPERKNRTRSTLLNLTFHYQERQCVKMQTSSFSSNRITKTWFTSFKITVQWTVSLWMCLETFATPFGTRASTIL